MANEKQLVELELSVISAGIVREMWAKLKIDIDRFEVLQVSHPSSIDMMRAFLYAMNTCTLAAGDLVAMKSAAGAISHRLRLMHDQILEAAPDYKKTGVNPVQPN